MGHVPEINLMMMMMFLVFPYFVLS